jgi:glycosyltransferase involved in cell wall biosynthesis
MPKHNDDRPLRVLMLADAVFEDKPGGSRVVARELAQGLAARGHQVTFLVARHNDAAPADERRGSVRIVRYPGAGSPLAFTRAGRQAAARLWAETPFDIAHTHFAYAALGPLAVLPRDVPHVRSFYGPWDEEGWVEDTTGGRGALGMAKARVKRRLRHAVEAANLRRSRAVVVLSRHSQAEVEGFHVPDAKIRLLPGGADTLRFVPAKDRATVRRSLGLPTGRPLLLSVRRLAARMGLDALIQAMPAVVARHPDVLLLIGGKGPERVRLEQRIAALGLADSVRLIGFIPDVQLAAHYQAADAFVLPTLALEGFGLVTAESLACGTPVLGTPVGATPELLGALEARLILPGTSPEALAAGINAFLAHGADWGLDPERLHAFVGENYSWSRHTEGMEALYRQVIARNKAPRAAS